MEWTTLRDQRTKLCKIRLQAFACNVRGMNRRGIKVCVEKLRRLRFTKQHIASANAQTRNAPNRCSSSAAVAPKVNVSMCSAPASQRSAAVSYSRTAWRRGAACAPRAAAFCAARRATHAARARIARARTAPAAAGRGGNLCARGWRLVNRQASGAGGQAC
jgi:hypothetical protein